MRFEVKSRPVNPRVDTYVASPGRTIMIVRTIQSKATCASHHTRYQRKKNRKRNNKGRCRDEKKVRAWGCGCKEYELSGAGDKEEVVAGQSLADEARLTTIHLYNVIVHGANQNKITTKLV